MKTHVRKPAAASKPVKHAPYPASNLGGHLKAPKSGEIVTNCPTWKRPK